MSLYSERVFPWLIDRVMSSPPMTEQRRAVLAGARGDTLEIGFGTGLNLPHYPPAVDRLTVVDPNGGMHRRAARRVAVSTLPIQAIQLGAEDRLPVADDRFDTVVSTWTMCSIPLLARALAEMARVLKPGGQLLFVEHGLSPEPGVARWQHRLTPIMKRIGGGCHLNRNIAEFVRASPLRLVECDEFLLRDSPRVGGYTYRGRAEKRIADAQSVGA